jgi:cell division septation protein DedD
MNRKSLRKWEVRLGLPHLVIIIGIVTGSMAGAFFLAYGSGLKEGFSRARESSLASSARIPVSQEQLSAEVSDELVSEVYAKLGNSAAHTAVGSLADHAHTALPELGAIESVHSGEVAHDAAADGHAANTAEHDSADTAHDSGAGSHSTGKHDGAHAPVLHEGVDRKHDTHSTVDTQEHQPVDHRTDKGHEGAAKTKASAVKDHHDRELTQLASAAGVRILGGGNHAHHQEASAHSAGTHSVSKDKAHQPATGESSGTLGALLKREEHSHAVNTGSNDHSTDSHITDTHAAGQAKLSDNAASPVKPSLFDSHGEQPLGTGDKRGSGVRHAGNHKAVVPALPRVGVKAPAQPLVRRSGVNATQSVSNATSGASVSTQVNPGWYAQVAAPSDSSDATSLAKKLRGSGFPVQVERAKVRGQEYYRVLVGPEKDRVYAERLVTQLKRESYLSGAPFIKKVR